MGGAQALLAEGVVHGVRPPTTTGATGPVPTPEAADGVEALLRTPVGARQGTQPARAGEIRREHRAAPGETLQHRRKELAGAVRVSSPTAGMSNTYVLFARPLLYPSSVSVSLRAIYSLYQQQILYSYMMATKAGDYKMEQHVNKAALEENS